ncbi:MAG: tetratricopeptide repeat protein, partial [Gammaproteobacteria bacterium]|nr:tetratricopeptide repeat protein [Gammaproteobacteria bacterium]
MTSHVDPNITVKAAFERASAMLHAGDMQMAEAICRDGLRRFPDDGNLLCLLGGVLIRQHRPVEAENPLRNVIERFPDFAKAHEELGNAMLAQRRLDEAAASLQRTLELEPGNDLAKLKLEKVQAALRRPDTAANGRGFLQEV